VAVCVTDTDIDCDITCAFPFGNLIYSGLLFATHVGKGGVKERIFLIEISALVLAFTDCERCHSLWKFAFIPYQTKPDR
jgi:hypothetical protein